MIWIRITFIGTVTQLKCHKDYKTRTFPKLLQFRQRMLNVR